MKWYISNRLSYIVKFFGETTIGRFKKIKEIAKVHAETQKRHGNLSTARPVELQAMR
jgi:hypothetical protein